MKYCVFLNTVTTVIEGDEVSMVAFQSADAVARAAAEELRSHIDASMGYPLDESTLHYGQILPDNPGTTNPDPTAGYWFNVSPALGYAVEVDDAAEAFLRPTDPTPVLESDLPTRSYDNDSAWGSPVGGGP